LDATDAPAPDGFADDGPRDGGSETSQDVIVSPDACSITCGLVSVVVTPSSPVIGEGRTLRLQATGVYADASTRDLTELVNWVSAGPATAAVSNAARHSGVLTALAPGSAVIVATIATWSGSTEVTVTASEPLAMSVSPIAPALARGMKLPMVATLLSTSSVAQDVTPQAAWTSSNPAVALVGSDGIVEAVALGTATIVAKMGMLEGRTPITVTAAGLADLVFNSAWAAPVGVTWQLTAMAVFSFGPDQDVTSQATWTSSDPAYVTVSNAPGTKGRVTGVAAGSAEVTASFGGLSRSITVASEALALVGIAVSPSPTRLVLRMTQPLQVLGHYANNTWVDITGMASFVSQDPAVATLNDNVVRGKTEGQTSIVASYGNFVATTQVEVRVAVLERIDVFTIGPTVPAGATRAMQASGRYADGQTLDLTTDAIWTTSNPDIGAVSNAGGSKGYFTAIAPGSVDITAWYAGVTTSTTIVVEP
jgi:trimeric autotransporter adhesin